MTTTKTRAQGVNEDITALLRARNTLLWISSREEMRVERAVVEAAGAATYKVRFWDCATGLTDAEGKPVQQQMRDPGAVLDYIRDSRERCVYVLRDLHKWFDPMVLRALRSLARSLQEADRPSARTLVLLTPSTEVPPELAGHATVLDYPIPCRLEMAKILSDSIEQLPEELRAAAAPNGVREQAIDAAVGLTAEEAANCYARSLVTQKGKIVPSIVAGEKKRVIAREKVLTWHDPDPRGLDSVGGLDELKDWLRVRRTAFSAKAREFGVPAPKGVCLVGVPGGGKSLTAKAVAAAWQMPLLRLDMGALQDKYVGESQKNIRRALAVAEAVSPCVVWLDEIEKALAGATQGAADGGVAADALGTVLSWMQERQGSVFVIATANDVRALPPELLRKGRFDEVFFVDLPTTSEREQVVVAALAKHDRKPEGIDLRAVADATAGFTGAEIAELVPNALFTAFAEGCRALTTADLVAGATATVPLSRTAAEKIEGLRTWAKGRARLASRAAESEQVQVGRALDIT